VLMGLSPLAPAWYVLALSLMGLVLGMWLRQSEGCAARAPGPQNTKNFFNQI
ncbi:MFS transporter, partial [Enterobacter intestinihominis]